MWYLCGSVDARDFSDVMFSIRCKVYKDTLANWMENVQLNGLTAPNAKRVVSKSVSKQAWSGHVSILDEILCFCLFFEVFNTRRLFTELSPSRMHVVNHRLQWKPSLHVRSGFKATLFVIRKNPSSGSIAVQEWICDKSRDNTCRITAAMAILSQPATD
jgi:hypothetical protein